MQRLNGKTTAEEIRAELKTAVTDRKQKGMKVPHLAAVLVGNDGGSMSYVGAKVKACDEIGFNSSLIQFDDSVTEEELLSKVEELNIMKRLMDLLFSFHYLNTSTKQK